MKKLLYIAISVLTACIAFPYVSKYLPDIDCDSSDEIYNEEEIQAVCAAIDTIEWTDSDKMKGHVCLDGETICGYYKVRECYRDLDTVVNYTEILFKKCNKYY